MKWGYHKSNARCAYIGLVALGTTGCICGGKAHTILSIAGVSREDNSCPHWRLNAGEIVCGAPSERIWGAAPKAVMEGTMLKTAGSPLKDASPQATLVGMAVESRSRTYDDDLTSSTPLIEFQRNYCSSILGRVLRLKRSAWSWLYHHHQLKVDLIVSLGIVKAKGCSTASMAAAFSMHPGSCQNDPEYLIAYTSYLHWHVSLPLIISAAESMPNAAAILPLALNDSSARNKKSACMPAPRKPSIPQGKRNKCLMIYLVPMELSRQAKTDRLPWVRHG